MAEPKSKPKIEPDSAPAIPASISFIEMENTMGPIKFEETKDSNGDPPTAIKGKRGKGRPKKFDSTKAVKKEDKQVNGDASDSPADDKAAEKTAKAGPLEGKDEKPAKKKKPVKKTIPAWASIDDDKKKKAASAAAPTSGALAVIEEAMVVCANNKGHASAAALRSYVKKEYPQWPKMTVQPVWPPDSPRVPRGWTASSSQRALSLSTDSLVQPGRSTWTEARIPVPRLVGQEWMNPYCSERAKSLPHSALTESPTALIPRARRPKTPLTSPPFSMEMILI